MKGEADAQLPTAKDSCRQTVLKAFKKQKLSLKKLEKSSFTAHLLHPVVVCEVGAVVGERKVGGGSRAAQPDQRLVIHDGRVTFRVKEAQIDVLGPWYADARLPPACQQKEAFKDQIRPNSLDSPNTGLRES